MESSTQQSRAVRELAEKYSQVRAQREALESQAKELKQEEEELKDQLINSLSAEQMPSVRFEGIGRFVLKPAVRYDILDIDRLCFAMFTRMLENAEHDRPMSDGLPLQKRPAKSVIEELAESSSVPVQEMLAGMGLVATEKMDLTFTRQKV